MYATAPSPTDVGHRFAQSDLRAHSEARQAAPATAAVVGRREPKAKADAATSGAGRVGHRFAQSDLRGAQPSAVVGRRERSEGRHDFARPNRLPPTSGPITAAITVIAAAVAVAVAFVGRRERSDGRRGRREKPLTRCPRLPATAPYATRHRPTGYPKKPPMLGHRSRLVSGKTIHPTRRIPTGPTRCPRMS